MSIWDTIFGKPLASSEREKEELTVLTGVPVLGLDALASTGYGPEAALTVLLPLGVFGLNYYPYIVLAIILLLTALYFSYQQTAAAYPNGGGAYIVAHANLGTEPAIWAAIALLLDYILNVAVGIAAGVGVVVSAFPELHSNLLALCLAVLLTLTFINLRGVRESGLVFILPVLVFVVSMSIVIGIGLFRAWQTGGHPQPVIPPPPLPPKTEDVSTWLLLAAFANGCTAMTGVEAVSNGVPLFRKPKVAKAQRTLTVIVSILGLFLLALGYLCPAYHISAMDEQKPGYRTILSQLIAAVTGKDAFYYIAVASIFIVLTYSAQTSFTDFPRVCRLLAQDNFLPHFFAKRGRRLVFSYGIVVLSLVSGVILITFGGVTDRLIPLFGAGAFSAFFFSQAGMVAHWRHRRGRGVRVKLLHNALGAAATGVVLIIIILAKFREGAWVTLVIVPAMVFVIRRIRSHYQRVAEQVMEPLKIQTAKLHQPVVIMPINTWDRVTEKALRFSLLLSHDIRVLHISTEGDHKEDLKALWTEKVEGPARAAGLAIPRLEIIDAPYRQLYRTFLNFIDKLKGENPDCTIAVIIPHLVEIHWYDYLFHNLYAAIFRTLLYMRRDKRIIVIDVPWFLHD